MMKKYLLLFFVIFSNLVIASTTPIYITGDFLPSINDTYDIGSSSYIIKNIFATNITATYFIGDGSQLTGIQQGTLILYFNNDNITDCCTGNKTLSSIYNSTEVTLSGTSLPAGDTLMGEWITPVGVPNINIIQGSIRVHVTGKLTAGSKSTQFYFKTYITNSTGGDERLISTSEYTTPLTSSRTGHRIWANTNEELINQTDRIRIKGYAYVSGTGATPSVEAYIQGASATRLEIPVGSVSIERFVPITGSIKNVDLNTHNISGIQSITGSNGAQILFVN